MKPKELLSHLKLIHQKEVGGSDLQLLSLALMDPTNTIQWQGGELTTLPWRIGMHDPSLNVSEWDFGDRWQSLPIPGRNQPYQLIPDDITPEWKAFCTEVLQAWQERDVEDDPGLHDQVQMALTRLGVKDAEAERGYYNAVILIRVPLLIATSMQAQHVLTIENPRAIAWALSHDGPIQKNLGELCKVSVHPSSQVLIRTDPLLKERRMRRVLRHERIPKASAVEIKRGAGTSLIATSEFGSHLIELHEGESIPSTRL